MPIEIPEFPRRGGEEAVKALYDYIAELEEQDESELADKQATVLIEIAKGMISSIQAER